MSRGLVLRAGVIVIVVVTIGYRLVFAPETSWLDVGQAATLISAVWAAL